MFNQISKLFKPSAVVVAILFLSGCGGGTANTSLGGSIVMNPDKITWKAGGGICDGTLINYHKVLITVYSSQDVPVANAPINVSLDLAQGTFVKDPALFPSYPMTLYDDPNWDASSSMPPTNNKGASYSTSVGSDGTKMLVVGVDLGCTYAGTLNVYSGTLYQVTSISVQP